MSILGEKLKQVSRGGARAIGFGATGKTTVAPLLLIAALSQVDEEIVKASLNETSDMLLFDIKDASDHINDITTVLSDAGKTPWGVRLLKADKESIDRLAESGCDFVILDIEAASQVLLDEKMGKVLEIDTDIEDSLIRTISKLPVDAIYVKDKQTSALTISHLLNYYRINTLCGKPSVTPWPRDISELEPLMDAGTKAVIVDPGNKDIKSRLKEVREAIDKLPPPGSRKAREKGGAALPGFRPEQKSQSED